MKTGDYVASLLSAVALLVVLLIVSEPDVDRQRSVIVIGASLLALALQAAVLVVYPFARNSFLKRMVKPFGLFSVALIVLLTVTSQPNKQAKINWSSLKIESALETKQASP